MGTYVQPPSGKTQRTRSPLARYTAWPAVTSTVGPCECSMCTLPSFTSTHSSNSGVCHGSAQPPCATTLAMDTAGWPLDPLPAYSVMSTSGVLTTVTGSSTRGMAVEGMRSSREESARSHPESHERGR